VHWLRRISGFLVLTFFIVLINVVVRYVFKNLGETLTQGFPFDHLAGIEKYPVIGPLAIVVDWVLFAMTVVLGSFLVLGPPVLIIFATWAVLQHQHRPHGILGYLAFIVLFVLALAVIWVLGIIGMSYCHRWGAC